VSLIARRVDLRPVRRRIELAGIEELGDAELLALMLGTAGANAIGRARSAIDAAGGLPALARSEPQRLAGMAGIGALRAARLAAAFEIGRRAVACRSAPPWRVRTPADVGERLVSAMQHLEREELRVLLLNTRNVVTSAVTVYAGNLAGSSVRVGEVYRDAVRRLAAGIVVVHNHPSGDPSPSADDLRITRELADAGRLLDIDLLDHVIVAAEGWVSLRALGAV
jgi:DNA repair protein RadC